MNIKYLTDLIENTAVSKEFITSEINKHKNSLEINLKYHKAAVRQTNDEIMLCELLKLKVDKKLIIVP